MFQFLSVVAVAQLLALGGGVGYLWGTGKLDGQRVEQIAAVLRGETPNADASPTSAPATQPSEDRLPVATTERIRQSREQAEIHRRLLDREIQVASQSGLLLQQMRIDLMRRSELLEKERDTFAAQRAAAAKQATTAGFQKDLDLVKSLSPKQAKALLMKRSEPDVVRMLSAMPQRAASQILGACKTDTELAWADKILQRISKSKEPASETSAGLGRTQTTNLAKGR